jgi:hypothetical protein
VQRATAAEALTGLRRTDRLHVAVLRLLGQAEIEGLPSEFFVLQRRIVRGFLDLLELPNRPAAVDVAHTRSCKAYARFARGLQLLSEDKFTEAREAFLATP